MTEVVVSGLSEMEMRILSELMEDWEDIPTMANTVTLRTGQDAERMEIKEALVKLVQADMARIALRPPLGGPSKELSKTDSLAMVADTEKHLQFDSNTGYWTDGGDPPPCVAITEAGFQKAGSILDERPYRWWWPPDWR